MKISIIIPVYNSEKFIRKCLDSVINQTYSNWEIIAVNDGSGDNSYFILTEYASKDVRIKVITQDNAGPGISRNEGIRKATGEYISFLDADDYVDEIFLEKIVKKIEESPDVVFIDAIREKPNGEIIRIEKMSEFKELSKDGLIRNQMTGKMPWGGWRKIVKSSVLKENAIEFSKDAVGEEALYTFRVMHHSNKFTFLDSPHYHYVSHQQSQSTKGGDDPWGMAGVSIKKYLVENGLYEMYERTLNSLGLTATIISIYRKAQRNKVISAVRGGQQSIKMFRKNYSFDLDMDSLENRVKYVTPFIRFNFVLPVVLIAMLKHFVAQNRK